MNDFQEDDVTTADLPTTLSTSQNKAAPRFKNPSSEGPYNFEEAPGIDELHGLTPGENPIQRKD